ncbi:MAG: hydrogenase expression/formation protein HypE [Treponema sp.]|nr:hydrogenase expression/formation protein HypE [Treponema sp.]
MKNWKNDAAVSEFRISLSHGNGGEEMSSLIESVFLKHFKNDFSGMEDSAVLPFNGKKLAFTTDSFVVKPLFFPGGDIGRLAVCGTVNDLLTTGGRPLYLSASFIIEENTGSGVLDKIAGSMREAADEAGVFIVTGDTKVIEGNGGLYINTSGIGEAGDASFYSASAGDAIIASGFLGEHHACILSRRMGIENGICSDAAPLSGIVSSLVNGNIPIHGMRDITRGGLATVLNEAASASGLAVEIEESALPVSEAVEGFSRILGLDPLYMGNEGKMLVAVPDEYSAAALELIRKSPYGENASIIGRFMRNPESTLNKVVLKTKIGGRRILPPLSGEGLPRIC